MTGYHLDADTIGESSQTCLFNHDVYPFCSEVEARACTSCLTAYMMSGSDCVPDTGSDYYSADLTIANYNN